MKCSAWLRFPLALASCIFAAATASPAQNSGAGTPASGMIEFVARAMPTAGRAEPVRQITFYLLKKSFADIRKEAEAAESKPDRSEEHTSELQSQFHLVCRLLLEK